MPLLIFSQGCFDADFESGTVGGYTAYQGIITSDGVISFNTQGISNEQHKIMRVQDGFDPIAEQYCELNNNLRVAGSGTGKYTLRLGNAESGARTSKIVLSFLVTADVSFFLLKYAVILNDPDHEEHRQPRFELNIKDNNGEILECGQYEVRAAADIPGFESCGNWRVRPWTTAGFELESYLGQTINIEIISTDCGLGGHGGYAYIDATCSPLELELDSYCPGAGFAKYLVTDGFDSYEWSTGENTRTIVIDDAVPGTEYSVTVTSSTGCTLVLRDTLPELPLIDDLELSFFDAPDTIYACYGEEIVYTPTGTNIEEVDALELGYKSDEFFIFADESKILNFVTRDNFGCAYDTTQLVIYVAELDLELEIISSCNNSADGAVLIDNLGDTSLLTSFDNQAYSSVDNYSNLNAGSYFLDITNSTGCVFKRNIFIDKKESPELQGTIIKPATCDEDNGIITALTGGDSMVYSFDNGEYSSISKWTDLAGGTYSISYKNEFGCIADEILSVDSFSTPNLSVTATDSVYCGRLDGEIISNVLKGYPPFEYSINSNMFVSNTSFYDLGANDYQLIVRDNDNCRDTVDAVINYVPYSEIKDVEVTIAWCGEDNGTLDITATNYSVPVRYYMDDLELISPNLTGLTDGNYKITMNDRNNCIDSLVVYLGRARIPVVDYIDYIETPCGTQRSKIVLHTLTYNDFVKTSFRDGPYFIGNEFDMYSGENAFRIQDDLGCTVDTIFAVPEIDNYIFANIFSPNDDGRNDYFCFQNKGGVKEIVEFQIHDRWGSEVFSAMDGNVIESDEICWDGMNNGAFVVPGVYVFTFQARLMDGRLVCKVGDVTVLR